MKQLSKTKPDRTGKLALIFLAFVFVIAGGTHMPVTPRPRSLTRGGLVRRL
jgi:hypothetical protein